MNNLRAVAENITFSAMLLAGRNYGVRGRRVPNTRPGRPVTIAYFPWEIFIVFELGPCNAP
jgi:hypothetical protein